MKLNGYPAGIVLLIVITSTLAASAGFCQTTSSGALVVGVVAPAVARPGGGDVAVGNGKCPYALAGYADGCAAASFGVPSHPNLLAKYKARPPWDVAGVDYAVGASARTVFRSWKVITDDPSFQISGNQIRCVSGAASLNAIDFSRDGGGYIYIPKGGCRSLTITNSRWACPHSMWPSNWLVEDQNGASVSITHSNFVGTNCGPNMLAWLTGSDITFEYNYSKAAPAHIIQARAPGRVRYEYNVIQDNATLKPNHSNDQEWNGRGLIEYDDVEFNTVLQNIPACNEVFQFYDNNNIGSAIKDPILRYNTIIAGPASRANNCGPSNPNVIMSYFIHGTSAGYPTPLIGTAINEFNYFDVGGAYGSYYPGSMKGWTSRGNIDLNTGTPIAAK